MFDSAVVTAFARTLLDDANQAAMQTTLGLVPGTNVQAFHADLNDLVTRWTPASAAGPAALNFAEDTDNGTNIVTLSAPVAVGSDVFAVLPAAGGTLATLAGAETLTNKTLTDPKITIAINAQTAAYTLVLTDASKLVTLTNALALTLSVPTDASVAFPIGTTIDLAQMGAGKVTVAAVTPGTTTVNGTPSLGFRAQYSAATLIKIAANNWLLVGDLA
jgi:hypothetical protein